MAIITPALLQALFTGFKKNFEDAKGEAPTQYTEIATVIKSTTKSNTYGWLGKFPSLRKWVGDRVIESMKAHGYQIVNEDFEATVGVDRNDIEDDELGIYAPLFQEMGLAAGVHPDELCFGLLGAGFTTPCYDSQYFFDTDHPVYPKADGTGTPVLSANLVVDGAYAGEPWFLLDTSRALKPIIFQERKAPQLIAMTKIDDEAVFTRKRVPLWGGLPRCRWLWLLAAGVRQQTGTHPRQPVGCLLQDAGIPGRWRPQARCEADPAGGTAIAGEAGDPDAGAGAVR